jgi:hypothetical protein
MHKYKSKFEEQIAPILTNYLETTEIYEQDRFSYTIPCNYTPDWKITPNLYVESKGLFDQADRRKMKIVKDTYPDITFIMLFQDPNKRIAKNSKTTYKDWCIKNGFVCTDIYNLISTIKAYL